MIINTLASPKRVCVSGIKKELLKLLKLNTNNLPIKIVCIGTDRATGDCAGPLIGTLLYEKSSTFFHKVTIEGTLDKPVTAKNLKDVDTDGYFVIAIDAGASEEYFPGSIKIKEGGLFPGRAINKNLPKIGDVSIICFVHKRDNSDKDIMESLKCIRLSIIYTMAKVISNSLFNVFK